MLTPTQDYHTNKQVYSLMHGQATHVHVRPHTDCSLFSLNTCTRPISHAHRHRSQSHKHNTTQTSTHTHTLFTSNTHTHTHTATHTSPHAHLQTYTKKTERKNLCPLWFHSAGCLHPPNPLPVSTAQAYRPGCRTLTHPAHRYAGLT